MKDKIILQRKRLHRIMSYIAVLCLLISLSLGVHSYILEKNTLNISGTITSVDYKNGAVTANVKYTVAGKIYENTISLNDNTDASVNDSASIKVDMRNPTKKINSTYLFGSMISFLLFIALGIIFLPSYGKERKKEIKFNLLRKTGFYIQAPITEIYANNKGKQYKKSYPSRLRCQYRNPQDNKQYIFDSEDTFLNLNAILKEYNAKTVTVYIDKTNTSNYYVDLNSLAPKVNIVDPIAFMKEKTHSEEKVETPTEETKKVEEKGNTE